ncbi:EAL domain-containing protein [Ancylothrix sp. C2]|uniref:EAL domain-containing response regulator n=1 Tax=Ancylothrix sp. D3o TaxID=2953691 RepID=UPI0021BAE820|nr:EAL domain-containing response regulator [Ancylothrix sp. D3o]MCT7948514.1 EAL domain-containing protein [Ancylothrix sp. D3o]
MKKILVIEDEDSIRSNLLEMLSVGGFEAIGAENGQVGVHLARLEHPDIILCDIMMPLLDGYGVLSALQQDALTSTIPVICLTAKSERSDLRKAMEMGASDYLTKPFTRVELLKAISTQLDKLDKIKRIQNTAVSEAISHLNDLVYYDSLTNLPNRLVLQDRFEQALAPVWATHTVPVAVLSLDQFDRLHSSLGTDYTDLLLQAVQERISPCIGTNGTVARLNSDQLALILPPILDKQEASGEAVLILNSLSTAFSLQKYQVFITGSLGISLYPSDGNDIDSLLKAASTAMKVAKQKGGNCYQVYNRELQEKSYDCLMLELELHTCLEKNQLQVYYQPQVDTKTGKIVAAEALCRWYHPEKGFIPPSEFIPIAEQTGLITYLDRCILQNVCQQLKIWRNAGYDLSIAVNLSAAQFQQANLTQQILDILKATAVDPQWLEFELTETAVVQNQETAKTTLQELKAAGLNLALDDFGTGYSSLSYLQNFPFDSIKIDRSFINNLSQNSKNTAIINAIIQLARSLNLKSIAEGVETQAQQDFIRQCGCDLMQGYWFSPPVTAAAFEEMLKQQQYGTLKPIANY